MRMKSSAAKWVFFGVLAVLTLTRLSSQFSEPLRIDACTAQGGKWSFEQDACRAK